MDTSQELNQIYTKSDRMTYCKSITLKWKWSFFRALFQLCYLCSAVFLGSVFGRWFGCGKGWVYQVSPTLDLHKFKGGRLIDSDTWCTTQCSWFDKEGISIGEDSRHINTTTMSHFGDSTWYTTLQTSTNNSNNETLYACKCSDDLYTREVFIKQYPEENISTVVPLGGIVMFSLPVTGLPHWNNMEIYYTFNDKPPIETHSMFRCSWLIHGLFTWPFVYYKVTKYSDKLFRMNICSSPDSTGTYKFFIRRQVFNRNLNKSETKEFQYPTAFTVSVDNSQMFGDIYKTVSITKKRPPELELDEPLARDSPAKPRLYLVFGIVVVSICFHFLYIRFVIEMTNRVVIYALYFKDNYEKRFSELLKVAFFCAFNVSALKAPLKFRYRSPTKIYIILTIISVLKHDVISFNILEYFCVDYVEAFLHFIIDCLFIVTIYTYRELVPDDNMESEALGGILPMDQFVKVYDVYLSYSDRDIIFIKDEILPILKERGYLQ
ncbi:uncharacterized protein LOC126828098 [Patella vulgata]|uniref:uncharacterized protein LOC126828098 n=1 Tax=Patella vulgata TaxID=6465 RepID=UPI00217FC229|nr:uncharacterized protein LOC126828098 [Patella vulgata]